MQIFFIPVFGPAKKRPLVHQDGEEIPGMKIRPFWEFFFSHVVAATAVVVLVVVVVAAVFVAAAVVVVNVVVVFKLYRIIMPAFHKISAKIEVMLI